LSPSATRFREIVASSAKVGAATVAGLIGWMVGGKILALELGAAGVGVFGILRQLLQNLTLLSTCNGSTALVQGLSSHGPETRTGYVASVGTLFLIGASSVAVVLTVGAPWLGPWLVPHPQAPAMVRWLAVAVLATTAQSFFTGLLNGHRAVGALVRSQLLAPLAVLAIAFPVVRLVQQGAAAGYVLMLAAPGTVVALAAWSHCRKSGWVVKLERARFSRIHVRHFLTMSSVLLATGLLSTGTQYFQARFVAAQLGLEQAGLYWVAWTLSMSYVTVLLGSYATYYMPSLSALRTRADRNALIRDYLWLALCVMPVVVAAVVVVKPLVVEVLFSRTLLPALDVMRWMLVGDLFKGVAWVLSFPMLAFAEMRWFFWTEAAFNLVLAGSSALWLIFGGGIEQLGVLFMCMYAVYLVAMAAYVRRVHGLRLRRVELGAFAAGLVLVVLMSLLTWHDVRIQFVPVAAFAACGAVFLYGMRRASSLRGAESPGAAPVPVREYLP
jgi:enterobacterial common antigen flippase